MDLTLQDSRRYCTDAHSRRGKRYPREGSAARAAYLKLLTFAFALFSSARVVAYLPTIWAIHQSGDASQHSVWTWPCAPPPRG
jgi:hypothetical protein